MTFIITHSGRRFDLLDPDPKSVVLGDITHALAHISRFTGHSSRPWTVAEHSILVAEIVSRQLGRPDLAFDALMHDAPEAYYGDIVSPLKALLPDYKRIYARGEEVIFRTLGVEWPLHGVIHEADRIALGIEWREIMPPTWKDCPESPSSWRLPPPRTAAQIRDAFNRAMIGCSLLRAV